MRVNPVLLAMYPSVYDKDIVSVVVRAIPLRCHFTFLHNALITDVGVYTRLAVITSERSDRANQFQYFYI